MNDRRKTKTRRQGGDRRQQPERRRVRSEFRAEFRKAAHRAAVAQGYMESAVTLTGFMEGVRFTVRWMEEQAKKELFPGAQVMPVGATLLGLQVEKENQ